MTIMDQIVNFINENKTFFEYQGYKPIVKENKLYLINQKNIEIEEFNLATFNKSNNSFHNFFGKNISFTIKEDEKKCIDLHFLTSNNKNFTLETKETGLKITVTEDESNEKHIYNIEDEKISIINQTDYFIFRNSDENVTKEYANNFIKEILLLEESMPTITSYIEQNYPIFSECIEKLQEARKTEVKIYTIKRKNNKN